MCLFMQNFDCVFIKESFFIANKNYIEMLDYDNSNKQSHRNYIYLAFSFNDNNFFVPFRTNTPKLNKSGIIFPLPTKTRPYACLDYRKILIINNNDYIIKHINVPNAQLKTINANKPKIYKEVENYINGYIKAVLKNRHLTDPKYKFSTLHNFHKELNLV